MKGTKQPAVEKLKSENLQLKKKVQHYTDELLRKNRELQIEAALERVRTVALGMKKAEDMLTICKTIAQQLAKLGVKEIRNVQTAVIRQEKGTYINYEFYAKHKKLLTTEVSYTDHAMTKAFINKMLDGPNEFFKRTLMGTKVKEWYRFQKQSTKQFPDHYLLKATSLSYYWYSLGPIALGVSTYEPLNKEEQELIVRFRNVFELSYRRFLDIEQAEMQAREARIEAALEKLRSRSLAMHKSEEMREIVKVVFERLKDLNFAIDGGVFIGIPDTVTNSFNLWVGDDHAEYPSCFNLPYYNAAPIMDVWRASQGGSDFLSKTYSKKEKNKWFRFAFKHTDFKTLPTQLKDWILKQPLLTQTFALAKHSGIGIHFHHYREITANEIDILNRFTKVFEQGYIRFLDLQKAEAQAREAQIEAALERVRSRSMAMHKSEELADLSLELVKQVQALGVSTWFCAFNINDDDLQGSLEWGSNGQGTFPSYRTPREGIFLRYYEAGQRGETLFINAIGKNECPAHYEYLCTLPGVGEQLLAMKAAGIPFPAFQIDHVAFFKYGYILFITYEPVPDAHDIFKRFAKVFEQTYTRFLDLQKAEAQAKEAQIEAALERIRSSAMAMHSSEGILEVTQVLREQVALLGEKELESILVHIYHEDTNQFEAWYSYRHPDNPDEQIINGRQLFGWSDTARARKDKEQYFQEASNYTIVADYTMLKEWYEYLFEIIPEVVEVDTDGRPLIPDVLYYNYSKISGGALLLITNSEASAHSKYLLNRAATVFNLAYSRFLDLQKAEAQTREAKIEASLERVRSKAMAMHNSQDLADTIGVFYNELTSYSITPRRCGVGLLNKENKAGELFTWNTTEQGESLELIGTIKMEGHPVLENVYNGWISQTDYYPILRGHEIKEYYKVIRPMIPFPDYDHDTVQYGYFFFFREGGVYAWTDTEMKEEELLIYRRFTSVLSLTYKRYKDLQHAEAQAELARLNLLQIQEEKQRAENALTELQSAQKQLIQSEKMASLGELTAGIAHEIQNPLNFVNNFSEVSKDLINELVEEAQKGNTGEVKLLADDLIGNLQKIHHHGERAASIVKGMLQHSRTSTGQKELTDINALCDEYLRLAYHGLRAKDKSFNASFTSEFDERVGSINIVPQDMGRVILNLINNAFYAVNEKKKTATDYTPEVHVKTVKQENAVLILIADNGNGIPQKIQDKIFQPFFTTKPTGEGTGLGLSLSYDIIKAHGGELKLQSTEARPDDPDGRGHGTIFTIQVPV